MDKTFDWKEQKKVRNFLLPSWSGVVAYIVIAFFILCALNLTRFWQAFAEGVVFSPESLSQTFGNSYTSFENFRQASALGDGIVLVFWVAIGSTLYLIAWLTQNSLVEVKREVGDGPIISGDMVKRNYLRSMVAHFVFFGALTVVTAVSLAFVLFFVLPVITMAFYGAAINISGMEGNNVLYSVASIILLAVIVHSLTLLLKIYVRFWQMYIRSQYSLQSVIIDKMQKVILRIRGEQPDEAIYLLRGAMIGDVPLSWNERSE